MHTVGLRTVTSLRRKLLSTLELNGTTMEQSKAPRGAAHAVLRLGSMQVLCSSSCADTQPAAPHCPNAARGAGLSAPVHSAAHSPTAGDAEMQ